MPAIRTDPMFRRPETVYDLPPWIYSASSARDNASKYASSFPPTSSVQGLSSAGVASARAFDLEREGSGIESPIPSVQRVNASSTVPHAPQTASTSNDVPPRRKKTCNPFMQFRRYAIANKLVLGCANMSEVSCRVADRWHGMSEEEKAPFYAMAAEDKKKAALGLLPDAPVTKRKRTRTTRPKPSKPRTRHLPSLPDDSEENVTSPSTSERSLASLSQLSSFSPELSTPLSLSGDVYWFDGPVVAADAFLMPSIARNADMGPDVSSCYPLLNGYNSDPNAYLFSESLPGPFEPSKMVAQPDYPLDARPEIPSHGELSTAEFGELLRQTFVDIFGF